MLSGAVRRRDGGQRRVVCLPYAERGAPVAKSAPLRPENVAILYMFCCLSTGVGTLSRVLLRPHRLELDAKLVGDVVDNLIYPPVPFGYASRSRESSPDTCLGICLATPPPLPLPLPAWMARENDTRCPSTHLHPPCRRPVPQHGLWRPELLDVFSSRFSRSPRMVTKMRWNASRAYHTSPRRMPFMFTSASTWPCTKKSYK
jgi:hypothetical protein